MVFTTKHVMYQVKESVFVTYMYAAILHSRSVGTVQGMLFTTKHMIYQVKVHLTWVGQGPPVMWFSQLPFQSTVHL